MIHDVIVIGGGISGASVAYELAGNAQVLMLEAETEPGYHSTGRSAALFTRNYGGPVVRQINAASAQFFEAPPDGFCDADLLTPRGAVIVADEGSAGDLAPLLALSEPGHEVIEISPEDAVARVPYLRPERVAAAIFEAGVTDIEVATLHQSYLKGITRRGGTILKGERVSRLRRKNGVWHVETPHGTHRGKIVVNAAGAWAEELGQIAGAMTIGLVPMRRTAIVIDAPEGLDVNTSPAVDFVASGAYIKPEAGKLMASPADASPTTAHDVRPEELDIAYLADWVQTETLIPVRRIAHSWAGLRSFVADEAPVVGFDPQVPDFLWLAGQGGYGIMMAPALAQFAKDLLMDGSADLRKGNSFDSESISPHRLEAKKSG